MRRRAHRSSAGLASAVGLPALVLALLASTTTSCVLIPGVDCPLGLPNSFWQADVRNQPVHTSSTAYVTATGASAKLKADFGSGLWDGGPIGIPYDVVDSTQPRVPMSFDYEDESDPGPYPVPAVPHIEGGAESDGDRHVLVIDKDTCRLWETWNTWPKDPGPGWDAGSGATFDLWSNAMRPAGWTSADAAGLPILPGLVRYEEVAADDVSHVIRMTVPWTANSYVWPASHKAPRGTNPGAPPMGTWFRLKASVDENRVAPFVRPIVRALKKHGAVIADNGSAWYLSGVPDERWNNDELRTLGNLTGNDFEAVDVLRPGTSLRKAPGSYEAVPTS